MKKGKIKAGWYIMLAVSIVVFLTAAGLFSYVVLFDRGNEPESVDIEPVLREEQPESVPEKKNEVLSPALRSFCGEIEWYDGGKWVPLESVEELEEGDPLTVALKTYREQLEEENSEAEAKTDAEGETVEASEQTAQGESEPSEISVKQGKVAEKSNKRPSGQQPPADSGKQESDPYL